MQRLPDGIIWRRADGTRLKFAPELNDERIRSALALAGMPRQPTTVKVDRRGAFGRVLIRESSGNLKLDELLVWVLTSGLFELEWNTEKAPNTGPASCFPAAGAWSRFEVEWRLFPGVRAAAPKPEPEPQP